MKIALFNLSDLASRENVATKTVCDLDKNTGKALFNAGMVLPCPDINDIRPSQDCLSCPYFKGAGYVEISGDTPLENRFRSMCACPRFRPLRKSSVKKTPEYREELRRRAKDLTPEENAVFVDSDVSVNCPLSRAKNGTWRVENPPCLACQYYGGLKQNTIDGKKGIGLLCSHVRAIRMTRPACGSMEILEEVSNDCTK